MATISHLFYIDAPQEKVMEAISTIKGLCSWWTSKTTGDDQLGGVLHFRFTPGAFIDLRVEENNGVDFLRWSCVDAHPEWLGTEATFNLSQNNGKTLVEFHHKNWASQTPYFANCNFSWGKYFVSLRDYCEKGTGQPFVE